MSKSPKSIRRLRRRVENEMFAKDARFWNHQKTVWSGHEIRRPVDKAAVRLVKTYPKKQNKNPPKRSVSVYLFRINTKRSDEIFLKIGVTNSLDERFKEDTIRYNFWLLGHVDSLTRREAIRIEKKLHALFADWSYRPRNGFVTGGHTECFVDYEPIVETTKKVFELVEEQKEALRNRLIAAAIAKGYRVDTDIYEKTVEQHNSPPAANINRSVELLKNQKL